MKELNFKQELTAAFGQPISENPTQVMIEAAYRHHQLDWRYLTIEVGPDDLEAAVKGAKVMGFQGFNCTIPHKVKVIEYLDGLGESASLMGAVNCVGRKNGQWIGENTDGKGFVSSLKKLTDPSRKKVVIFGAGGAARAISVEVALAGASHITIVNRSAQRGEELTKLLQDKLPCYADYTAWENTYSIPALKIDVGWMDHFLDRRIPAEANTGHLDIQNTHATGGADTNLQFTVVQS